MENPFEIIIQRLDKIEKILLELKEAQKREVNLETSSKQWMNVEELAKYLFLSKQAIYQLCHKRILPRNRIGKKLYFRKSEIDEWISRGRLKTTEEINAEAVSYLVQKKKR